jgi:DJ-1 family protein
VVAGENNIATCSHGIKIITDKNYTDIEENEEFAAIVLPGGKEGVEHICNNDTFQSILKRHNNSGKLIAAICAAPTILYDLRLLKNDTKLTSHPSVRKVFNQDNYCEDKVVISENIITSRGAGTCFDFALELIKILKSEETAIKVKEAIVY